MDRDTAPLMMRPRFRKEISLSADEIKEILKKSLKENPGKCHGEIVQNHIILRIPPEQQHYWSPQLTLQLEEENGKTLMRGLFGPKPAVWTMFVFFYSAIGFFTLMGLMFGLSQWMLKMEPWGLWFVPAGLALLTLLYTASKIGQGLGREQMHQLQGFLYDSLPG